MRKFIWILAALALAALACNFAQPAQPTATMLPSPVVQPGQPEDSQPQPGDYELTIVNGADRREVLLHLPPAYDGETQLPLLIVLHGGGGSGQQVRRSTGMDADADEYGFIVAYPNGSGRLGSALLTWNAGHCCGYAMESAVDDVGLLRVLIGSMVAHYAVDPAHIYITGMSNGGMMAHRAGAELADLVAGIAPVAASVGGQASAEAALFTPPAPASPVAVIAFNGMADQHVLYEGGLSPMAIEPGRIDLSVADSLAFWVAANGCNPLPSSTTRARGNVLIETYADCDGSAAVVQVTIIDGQHAWPGGRDGLIGDPPSQDVSANQMMLEFFLQHPKQ